MSNVTYLKDTLMYSPSNQMKTIQYLTEMICDQVAAAIARNAKYEDIYKENKERYMKKWLPENLAIICTNTFIDLWNTVHENK